MGKSYYLTTAIDYVNGRPHLGHVYEKVGADAMARFKRLQGQDVFFLTGTDEHSLNVLRAAAEAGVPVEDYSDRMAGEFREICRVMGISHDRFIRTTDTDHVIAVQKVISQIEGNSHFYLDKYRGWYCASCEAFLDEGDLVGGECPVHSGKRPEWVEEDNWFFALSRFQDRLLDWIQSDPSPVRPESRKNEIVNRLRLGLRDVSVSRASVHWGVPLPWDAGHVVYVWFDALINYLTGAGYGRDETCFARCWDDPLQCRRSPAHRDHRGYAFPNRDTGKILVSIGDRRRLGQPRHSYLKTWGKLRPGTRIRRGEPVFPRLDVEKILARMGA